MPACSFIVPISGVSHTYLDPVPSKQASPRSSDEGLTNLALWDVAIIVVGAAFFITRKFESCW